MQTVSQDFQNICQEDVRQPLFKLEVKWNGLHWTDETDYLTGFDMNQRIVEVGGALAKSGTVDTAVVRLNNKSNRFSCYNDSGSDVFPHVSGPSLMTGIAMRLSGGYYDLNGLEQMCYIFTGFIYNSVQDAKTAIITLNCRDALWPAVQKRITTSVKRNAAVDEMILDLVDLTGVSHQATQVDASPYIIPISWQDDDGAADEMRKMAASAGGTLYASPDGYLHYKGSDAWVRDAPVWEFAPDRFTTISDRQNPDELLSKVVVEYAPRQETNWDEVYSLDSPVTLKPGESDTIDIRLSYPMFEMDIPHQYWFVHSSYLPMNNHCELTAKHIAQRVEVNIRNRHDSLSATLTELRIYGVPIVGGPTGQIERENNNGTDRVRSIRGNFYIQTPTQARMLANFANDRYARMIPQYTVRNVPAVPFLEVGDRVTVIGPPVADQPKEAIIISIGTSFNPTSRSAPAYSQTFTILDATTFYARSNYYVIGVSDLSANDAAWY
jgi:hypothetical protein